MLLKSFSFLLILVLGCALTLAVPLVKDEETSSLDPVVIPQNSTETGSSSDSFPSDLETSSVKPSSTTSSPSIPVALSSSPLNNSTSVKIENDSQNSTVDLETGPIISSTSTSTTQAPSENGKESSSSTISFRRPVHIVINRKKLAGSEAKSQVAPGKNGEKKEEEKEEENDFSEEEDKEEDEDFDDDEDDEKRSEKLKAHIVNGHASPWACDEGANDEKVEIKMQ